MFTESFLRKLERMAFISRQAMVGKIQGERRSPKRGGAIEFADFRPYVIGDDIRRIDWNAYARLEKFFIKLFVEEEDLTVHILIDNSLSMNWGDPTKLYYATQIAGAIGYIALASLDSVTVSTLSNSSSNHNHFLPPIRGKKSALSLFSFLESIKPNESITQQIDPKSQLNAYATRKTTCGPLLILSDFMNDGWDEGINNLASRGFEITLIQIHSAEEISPDLSGDFKLMDSETLSEIEITADFEILEKYHNTLVNWHDKWRKYCRTRGINYVCIDTTITLDTLLFAWLREKRVLR